MIFINTGKYILPLFGEVGRSVLQPLAVSPILCIRSFAARKGTRERKAKKHVKKVVEKAAFIPFKLRKKEGDAEERPIKKFDDSHMPIAEDNVFHQWRYRSVVYPFEEAVKCHREVQHPDMYNNPTANLMVTIELNMQGEKKTRFLENFRSVASIPHKFDHGEERTVLAFVKDEAMQEEVRNAGAHLVGGTELVKSFQSGSLSMQDFTYVIAHPSILPELVPLRGLMKRKFPSPRTGSLDVDLPVLVAKFLNGINYMAVRDEHEKDFGQIETKIGTINMEPKHLEENFIALLKNVITFKPKRSGYFISRCLLLSPPSDEKLKVDHLLYITDDTNVKQEAVEDEADAEEEAIGVA